MPSFDSNPLPDDDDYEDGQGGDSGLCPTCGKHEVVVSVAIRGKQLRRCALCYSVEVSNAKRTADRLVWDGEVFRRANDEERAAQDRVRNTLFSASKTASKDRKEAARQGMKKVKGLVERVKDR